MKLFVGWVQMLRAKIEEQISVYVENTVFWEKLHSKINDNDVAVWISGSVQYILRSVSLGVGRASKKNKNILKIPMNYIMIVKIFNGIQGRPANQNMTLRSLETRW